MGDSKKREEKKQSRKKMSKQTILTIAMMLVSVFVISIATYAWYMISNTPKITTAQFVADTIGNLQIANQNDAKTGPATYSTSIGMFDGLTSQEISEQVFTPCTTADGKTFAKAHYVQGVVDSVEEFDLNNDAEKKDLYKKYVYEKVFYLRAGDASVDPNTAKKYDIHFVGMSTAEQESGTYDSVFGTFMRDNTVDGNGDPINDGQAARCVRISFEVENSMAAGSVMTIYEPNADEHNDQVAGNHSTYTNASGETYGDFTDPRFNLLQQKANKSFNYTSIPAHEVCGDDSMSNKICTIKEGQDVKITMRIWVEGMDEDCTNAIATDKFEGQIQFISTENIE